MIHLAKDSIDVGIVIRDSEASLRFYRDTLGLEHIADIPMPAVLPTGTMHRLACGTSLLKLLSFDDVPPQGPGGLPAEAAGIRYVTLTITGLTDTIASLDAAGYRVVVPPTEIRTGVTIAVVEDPDGNVVELLETTQP